MSRNLTAFKDAWKSKDFNLPHLRSRERHLSCSSLLRNRSEKITKVPWGIGQSPEAMPWNCTDDRCPYGCRNPQRGKNIKKTGVLGECFCKMLCFGFHPTFLLQNGPQQKYGWKLLLQSLACFTASLPHVIGVDIIFKESQIQNTNTHISDLKRN